MKTSDFFNAAKIGDIKRLQEFLDAGLSVDEKRALSGTTALVVASLCGKYDTVEFLLNHGSNPDATGFDGRTALDLAASYGRFAIVKLLLERGANVQLRGSHRSPLEYALLNDHLHVALLLAKQSKKLDEQDQKILSTERFEVRLPK